jgi:potassium-transporting ATPase KdpC subunit
MTNQLRLALTIFILLTVVTGVVYPLLVTGIAQMVFPYRANGSVMEIGGKAVGSELIGQPFDDPRYFWSRPSATDKFAYNSASSTGSNLGPTNPDHLKAVKERIETIRQAHPDQQGPVPVDLVATSASGLDPHISPGAAEYQSTRVAGSRGLTVENVRRLVAEHTEGRTFGVLGEPRVHVLRLNLALDEKR